ncbi:MAG: histidine phosphatase family protein [Pseudomonadota bacterium]|uniref:histidine phosphatase family protein n=1 Tax=Phenylobacterium sp. TaxID=1871053 RepID=UPI002727129D|nr:histidine phosphatase family protein [Phenylobacterium sp.]MDO9432738.1 histidine phosphatase family protein [Phenylobacterium sp.]
MTDHLLFVTHSEVVIDPDQPITDWPLSAVGRTRMVQFAQTLAAGAVPVVGVWSSDERKARDGAEIIAAHLGLDPRIEHGLHENDRSATGYIAPPEFWEVVAQFFGRPDESVRGWETARDAQARIVRSVERVLAAETAPGLIVVVSHGGVGQLLTAHLQGVEIGLEDRPGNPGGGCWIAIDRQDRRLEGAWRDIEDYQASRVAR